MAIANLLDERGQPVDYGTGARATPAAGPTTSGGNASIDAAYQKYLGRRPGAHEYGFWLGNQNYEEGIKASPEAQKYAQGQTYQRTYAPTPGFDAGKLNNPAHTTTKYNFARAAQEYGTGDLAALVNYYNTRYNANARVAGSDLIDFGEGPVDVLFDQEGQRRTQFNPLSDAGGSAPSPGAAATAGGAGTTPAGPSSATAAAAQANQAPSAAGQVFSDPATSQWEQLLRSLIDRMNQPVPELSEAQRDVRNTQVLDPLTRERDAQKQRALEYYGARGHRPGSSGILDQALAQIDRQFAQMRTQQQGNFATQDIGRMDQAFNQNENRAMNAVNIFQRIPQLADQRLAAAQQTLIPSNPYQLLALQNQTTEQQQRQAYYQQMQDQQFWGQLAQLFAGLLT